MSILKRWWCMLTGHATLVIWRQEGTYEGVDTEGTVVRYVAVCDRCSMEVHQRIS